MLVRTERVADTQHQLGWCCVQASLLELVFLDYLEEGLNRDCVTGLGNKTKH